MKFQIIGPDNKVALDGRFMPLDLKSFGWHPAYHAVQFEDDYGEIEFTAPLGGVKPPNMRINRDQFLSMFGPIVEHVQAAFGGQS